MDLSHNKLNDPEIFDILQQMPQLKVLNLMGNPIIRNTTQYRRNTIARLKHLTYLDDKPVFDSERLAVEAWVQGGIEAERNERERQRNEENAKHQRDFEGNMNFKKQH